MAILAECPTCHNKQSTKNRHCKCGEDLVKAKKSRRVKYWINYCLPGGKQRRECVGTSIEEARAAEGKRRGQKKENRIFDMLPEGKITFGELAEWYLNLSSVKDLISHRRYKNALRNFNKNFEDWTVRAIQPMDLEDYQNRRSQQGIAPATINEELTIAKAMVNKAFDNDKVDGRVLKVFRKAKRKFKRGSNARDRILSLQEYLRLRQVAKPHLKRILITAFNTGMRLGELLKLKWSHIDMERWFIRLPADMTKEKKAKNIPINRHVKEVIESLPRGLPHVHVFTYKGQPIVHDLKSSLKTACRKAGVRYGMKEKDGFRFHDIRTTVKTNMLRAGVDKALRDTILGHSLNGMDAYYLKPTDEDLREAMDKYTEWLDTQLSAILDQVIDQESDL